MKKSASTLSEKLSTPDAHDPGNAGLEPSVIVENVKAHKGNGYGYDVVADDYTDMFKAGIIDPPSDQISSAERSSFASILLTTEVLVAEAPKRKLSSRPEMDMDY
jgi:chaperonin GroEL